MNITNEVVRGSDLIKIDLQRKKQKQDKAQLNLLRSWLANHFQGCRTASITIHLKRDLVYARFGASEWKVDTQWKTEDQADSIVKLYFNQLNERLYGKAYRRYNKHVRFCAALHTNGGNPHLHIVAEIPDDRGDLELLKAFTEEFCRQPSMVTEVARKTYVEETRSNDRALCYNNDDAKCRDFEDIDGTESLRFVR